jgi:microsomal epoxide hydrolase
VDIDFRIEDVTRLFNKIAPSLGFGKDYIVQRGDLGSKVARVMAAEHAACNAAHINFCIMPEPSQPIGTIDELETRGLESAAAFSKTGSTYSRTCHTPKHDCLRTCKQPSYLVVDRRKFLGWTDEDPPVDVVLESVTLY